MGYYVLIAIFFTPAIIYRLSVKTAFWTYFPLAITKQPKPSDETEVNYFYDVVTDSSLNTIFVMPSTIVIFSAFFYVSPDSKQLISKLFPDHVKNMNALLNAITPSNLPMIELWGSCLVVFAICTYILMTAHIVKLRRKYFKDFGSNFTPIYMAIYYIRTVSAIFGGLLGLLAFIIHIATKIIHIA